LSPLLQERNFGDLRGTPFAELMKKNIRPFEKGFHPPNGESIDVFRDRVDQAWVHIQKLGAALPEQEVLVVVTHGLVLDHLAKKYVDIPEDMRQYRIIPFRNTSVTLLNVVPGSRTGQVVDNVLNDDSHLESGHRDKAFGTYVSKL